MIKITIFQEKADYPVNKALVRKQVSFLFKKEKVASNQLVIHYVGKKTICSLHKKYFSDPSATDCISFPFSRKEAFFEKDHLLGEIFICVDFAKDYAERHQLKLQDELTLYLIHGILHLCGYNDISPSERKNMKKKEKECISFLKKEKLS